jgi:hypothetical protein
MLELELPTLLNIKEAAKALRCSPRTLDGLRTRGNGPAFVRIGGRIFYEPEAIRQYVANRTATATSQYAHEAPSTRKPGTGGRQ